MDSKLKSMIPLTYNWALKTIAKAGDYLDLEANMEYVQRKVFGFKAKIIKVNFSFLKKKGLYPITKSLNIVT